MIATGKPAILLNLQTDHHGTDTQSHHSICMSGTRLCTFNNSVSFGIHGRFFSLTKLLPCSEKPKSLLPFPSRLSLMAAAFLAF